MKLIIDIGNTRAKIGVFTTENKYFKAVEHALIEDEINFIFKHYPSIKNAIISASGEINSIWIDILRQKTALHIFSSTSKVPFKNNYATPKTLGLDRKALVAAAVHEFPNQNTLIIDLGTCITYDFVDARKTYYGGAISPGVKMRFKAMNNFTANLPLLEKEINEFKSSLIGDSTEKSMFIGVFEGVIKEVQGFVNDYEDRFTNLTVILCGGDANLLAGRLKNSIFANSNFQLKGLNYILEQNSINV